VICEEHEGAQTTIHLC